MERVHDLFDNNRPIKYDSCMCMYFYGALIQTSSFRGCKLELNGFGHKTSSS